ncbi:MAG: hypothetical protein GC151_08445 [Betaproteobacteria bacterium]|nr:hypothetical protein [Betaproteobacteria bacterium]
MPTALTALVVVVATVAAVALLVRAALPPRLSDVAAHVDVRTGGRDELLSALWFAQRPERDAMSTLHVARACDAATRLAVPHLFAYTIPRAAVATAVVAVLAATGIRNWPERPSPNPVGVDASQGRALPAGGSRPDGGARREAGTATARNATHEREDPLVAARDAGGAESSGTQESGSSGSERRQLGDGVRMPETGESRATGAAVPGTRAQQPDQMNDTLAAEILARVRKLLAREEGDGGGPPAARNEAAGTTGALGADLRAEEAGAQDSARREPGTREDALNTSLRALSRRSTAGVDRVHGAADTAEGAGRAGFSGGAMGRRIDVAQAGGGNGDAPPGKTEADPNEGSILGKRTERLAVQLRLAGTARRDDDHGDAPRDAGSSPEESFYEATRGGSAAVAFSEAGPAAGGGPDAALRRDETPRAFRDAVSRYTLARHRRERQGDGAER